MKRLYRILGLLVIMLVVLSIPVLATAYTATISVTNASGSALTNTPFMASINNTALATSGFIAANGLDTEVKDGTTELPRLVCDDKLWFVGNIPSTGVKPFNYINESTPDASMEIITGSGGYITTLDAAALEPADNFELDTKGYINTAAGANKNIIAKSASFYTYISGASEVSSAIYGGGVASTEILRPDGVGFVTAIPRVQGSPNHWENVDEAVASDADYNYCSSDTGTYSDYYTIDTSVLTFIERIDSIDVYVRGQTSDANTANNYFRCGLRLGGVDVDGTQRAALAWTTYNEVIARPGGGSWSYADLSTLQIKATVNDNGANSAYISQIYIVVNYTPSLIVTATGITSGIRRVVTEADGVDLTISVYTDADVLIDDDTVALAGASVTDNANNWVFYANSVMPYANYYKHTVNGTLIVWYQPNAIILTTVLPDREGAAQNGAFTWGTLGGTPVGNPVNVTVSMTSFVPDSLSEAVFTALDGTTFITDLPDAIPNMYDEGETGGLFGLEGLVNPALALAGIPESMFWYPLAFAVAIALGFLAYGWTRQLLVQAVVSGVVMALFSIGGVLGDGLLPFWTVLIFIIEAILLMVIQERQHV